MNREKLNREGSRPKDFGFKLPKVDRKLGHVSIEYNGTIYRWFLREDGRTTVLLNADEHRLTEEVIEAMQLQVRSILRPELIQQQEQS